MTKPTFNTSPEFNLGYHKERIRLLKQQLDYSEEQVAKWERILNAENAKKRPSASQKSPTANF